ncbi:hypothetical protein EVAR_69315_1 [Eumeta japonica]|uniref:Major facilitator superfamily associated domain-containing protein n=1 Tax=Eumeta variegata TaxID=151549 RepID=A0A4C1TM99_EUMVA|nr:hypothetical protein EVAR_69315_1 [Eumeta japonica]
MLEINCTVSWNWFEKSAHAQRRYKDWSLNLRSLLFRLRLSSLAWTVLNVFGKQLGASPAAMGLVTAVLPLLWALAKPAFGYLVDYFTVRCTRITWDWFEN